MENDLTILVKVQDDADSVLGVYNMISRKKENKHREIKIWFIDFASKNKLTLDNLVKVSLKDNVKVLRIKDRNMNCDKWFDVLHKPLTKYVGVMQCSRTYDIDTMLKMLDKMIDIDSDFDERQKYDGVMSVKVNKDNNDSKQINSDFFVIKGDRTLKIKDDDLDDPNFWLMEYNESTDDFLSSNYSFRSMLKINLKRLKNQFRTNRHTGKRIKKSKGNIEEI